jgi:hypothetical protein
MCVQVIVEFTTEFFTLFVSPETYGPEYNLTLWGKKRDMVVSHENSIF